ncbi:MAG: hypothetical protein AAB575_05500 [Patescibacteria group bacterium]
MSVYWDFNYTDAIIILVFVALIALFITARYFVVRNKSEVDRKFYREQWKKILEIMSYGKEMNCKLAVIEADKLLDEALKAMCFPGATMAERLKFGSYKFPQLKHVWWAHNVRNQVVHESRYVLKNGEAKIVLRLFRDALRELNVL